MKRQGGWRDETFDWSGASVIAVNGLSVQYVWGWGAKGSGYGVMHEDDWLIFETLAEAVDFYQEQGR